MKQEQQVKELAGEIFKLMHPGDKFRIGNNRTDYLIDLADEVLILNVGGYIGESTRSELEYAKRKGKVIRYLHPELLKGGS